MLSKQLHNLDTFVNKKVPPRVKTVWHSKVMSGGWQLHFAFEKTRIRFLNWKITSITDSFAPWEGA